MLTSNYSSYVHRLIHHQASTPFPSFTITRLYAFSVTRSTEAQLAVVSLNWLVFQNS